MNYYYFNAIKNSFKHNLFNFILYEKIRIYLERNHLECLVFLIFFLFSTLIEMLYMYF